MKKTLLLSLLIFSGLENFAQGAASGSAYSTLSSCMVDQNQSAWNGGTSERNQPGYYDWQSFTAGATGTICEVDIMFCNISTIVSGTGTLNIFNGTGIAGTLLTTQNVSVNGSTAATNTPFWAKFIVTTPPSAVTGQIYTFQFIPTQGGGLPDPYLIQINIPSVYAAGTCYNFGTGGCLCFATYVNAITTGIKTLASESGLSIYPNPAVDQVTITIPEHLLNTSYMITDQLGRVLISGKFNGVNSVFDISSFAPGIYFLKTSEPGEKTMKILKR